MPSITGDFCSHAAFCLHSGRASNSPNTAITAPDCKKSCWQICDPACYSPPLLQESPQCCCIVLLAEKLSLTGLSQKFNLNSYYISKLFKEYTNQTFVEYLTWVRVTKAVQLIAEKRYSFKEIANMVGYNDPSYFSKVFKKITGKNPREYCDEALN